MKVINNTDEQLSSGIEELVQKVDEHYSVSLTGPIEVTELTETGLATVEVSYTGRFNLKHNQVRFVEQTIQLYTTTLGDVELSGFDSDVLELRVYDRA